MIPVLGTSPSIFGQALASYVLCMIGELSVKDVFVRFSEVISLCMQDTPFDDASINFCYRITCLNPFLVHFVGNKLYEADSGERMSKNLKHKVRQVLKKDEV